MTRKLKGINDPSNIKEWTEAMQSIYRVLEDFSRNEDLSTPPQMIRTKWEIHRAASIDLNSSDKKGKDKEGILGMILRPVVKGVRSTNLKVASRSIEIRKKLFEKAQVSGGHAVDYVGASEGIPIEAEGDVSKQDEERDPCKRKRTRRKKFNIEDKVAMRTTKGNGDVSNLDKLRMRERSKKLKELWKQALCRMCIGKGQGMANCDDQELGQWCLGATWEDKLFKQQLEVDFPEAYPLGSSFELIEFDELQAYLRFEMDRFYS